MNSNNCGNFADQMQLTERKSNVEDTQLGVTNSETSFVHDNVNEPPLYSRPFADSDSIARTSLGYGNNSTLICDDSTKSFSTLDTEVASNDKGSFASGEALQKSDSDISRYFHSNEVASNSNMVDSFNSEEVSQVKGNRSSGSHDGSMAIAPLASGESSIDSSSANEETSHDGSMAIAPLASGESSIDSSSANEETSSRSECGFLSAVRSSWYFIDESLASDETPTEETYAIAESLDSAYALKCILIDGISPGNSPTDTDSINQQLKPYFRVNATAPSSNGDPSMRGVKFAQTYVHSISPTICATTFEMTRPQNVSSMKLFRLEQSRNEENRCSKFLIALCFTALMVVYYLLISILVIMLAAYWKRN